MNNMDLKLLLESINRLKKASSNFYTNCFYTYTQLEELFLSQEIIFEIYEACIFILEQGRDFLRLFYYSNSLEELYAVHHAMGKLSDRPVVIDIVGHMEQASKVKDVYVKSGFKVHRIFQRMTHTAANKHLGIKQTASERYAAPEDAKRIHDLIIENFDVYSEHLPAIGDVLTAIDREQIIIHKHENDITGFIFFETSGKTSTLRYWLVSPDWRGKGIGNELLSQYLCLNVNIVRYLLWVDSKNMTAINSYTKAGFKPDGLVDYIMLINGVS